ncbi:hypothetical protein AB688_18435 [Pseudomonas putida]|uniref:hypothetical protein n=1 Tax=Pseudomonas putida TaxID=303 RepID=UPI0007B6A35C|nr:hypothetical protein [Pseudomonas putida]ANC03983.1 hypothetical protein AB688_18435 [Pseudomonas putida]
MTVMTNCVSCGDRYPLGRLIGHICRHCIGKRQDEELKRAEDQRLNQLADDLVLGKNGVQSDE